MATDISKAEDTPVENEEVTDSDLDNLSDEELDAVADEDAAEEEPEVVEQEEGDDSKGAKKFTENDVRQIVRSALAEVRAGSQQPPTQQEEEGYEDEPVTRKELDAAQKEASNRAYVERVQNELLLAQEQFGKNLDDELRGDVYYAAIRRIQGNPRLSTASAYKSALKAIDGHAQKTLQRRAKKYREGRKTRGEAAGGGGTRKAAKPNGLDVDANDEEAVIQRAIAEMERMERG